MDLGALLTTMRAIMQTYFSTVVGKINGLIGVLASHIGNTNNPHRTDKEDVGLGELQNYPIASKANATVGKSNHHYMTPRRTKEAIETQVYDELADIFDSLTAEINDEI